MGSDEVSLVLTHVVYLQWISIIAPLGECFGLGLILKIPGKWPKIETWSQVLLPHLPPSAFLAIYACIDLCTFTHTNKSLSA